MNKMLVAIDGSDCALKAVRYAGEHFHGLADLQITLLHVLPMPAVFWDEGHVLNEEERDDRRRFFAKWKADQARNFESAFKKAVAILVSNGIKREQIVSKEASDTIDAADRILEEANSGGYQTLLVGHCRHDQASHFIRGSVTKEIAGRIKGATFSIVE